MAKRGKATGGSASAELLAANGNRDYVTILLNSQHTCSFAFEGEAAVLDEGLVFTQIGATVTLFRELARGQINVIGDNALISWQEGPLSVHRTGYLS